MRNEEISAKIGQNENAKNKTRIAGIYFSICLWYSTWFILYSIYFSPYFNQRVGLYAAFDIWTNCARMTSLYSNDPNISSQLLTDLINIYTQYQVVSRSGRMLFKVIRTFLFIRVIYGELRLSWLMKRGVWVEQKFSNTDYTERTHLFDVTGRAKLIMNFGSLFSLFFTEL